MQGKIEIDLKILLDEGLEPNEYVFLFFIYKDQINSAYTLSTVQKEGVQELERQGYLRILSENRQIEYQGRVVDVNEPKVQLLQKGTFLFEDESLEAKWIQFKALYPVKDGEGRLHNNQEDCKKKYLKLIKERGTHESIIQGLRNQIKSRDIQRIRNKFVPEWKMMSTWLNQKDYEMYLENVEDVKEEKDEGRNIWDV